MEKNIYSCPNEIYNVTKQGETYEVSEHHAEQLCKEFVPHHIHTDYMMAEVVAMVYFSITTSSLIDGGITG